MENYLKALKNYLRTPKGRHDFFDFLKAAGIIFLTALLVGLIFYWSD